MVFFQAEEAWLEKVLALKSSQLSLISGIPVWKERTKAYKYPLSSTCVLCMYIIISTKKKNLKCGIQIMLILLGALCPVPLLFLKKAISFSRSAKHLEA